MGILASLETRATWQAPAHPRDPVVAAWFGGGSNSAAGVSVTPDSAMRVTAVFRCVSILAQTYASLPLTVDRLLPGGGQEPDPAHPLFDLLAYQPNPWQTSFEWREMMGAHFALRGACYSEKIGAGGRGIAALVPLHPDHVAPFRAPDGRLAFSYRRNGTEPARIILQDEMHWMHLLPLGGDPTKPFSPISLAREAVGLSMATEEHAARLFSNGARPGGVLKMAGRLKDKEARDRLRESWNELHGGLRNSNKVAVLEDGLEWQAMGMTSEDAQFIETRGYQLAEIARIFGVPPHKIADLARSTNNNIEHQGIEFVTDTVRPGAIRWEQAMQRDLFYGKRTHCVAFDLDGLMRGDSAARAAWSSVMLQNGVLNRNEVRVAEGRNPSAAEGMNDYTVQTNMALIQLLDTMSKAAQQQKGATNGNQE
jgi:HK97 family phage portal protein